MFEKEAKKWVKENTRIEHSASFGDIKVEPSAEKGFIKGAEFGYNKANEWHNIKENPNDLPNDGELVVADNGLAIDCVKFRKNEFGNSWSHDEFELCDVIYWKKLVLSKDRNK